jgi:long-chain acyl-CoA synthetase
MKVEKIWLRSYPKGVPEEINPDAYQSLVQIFEESCLKYSDLPSYYNLGVAFTYKELEIQSRAFAAYLQNELKLKKGDRLAIMLPNILQYPVAMYGALRAGLIVVNVNPLYTANELAFQLKDSGAETIVVLANFASTVQKVLSDTPLKNIIVTKIGDFFSLPKSSLMHFILKYVKKKIPSWHIPNAIAFKQAIAKGKTASFNKVELNNKDIAFLQYTGGTTGIAKGAMLTHRNIIANILQAEAWFSPVFERGKEVIITALPLYHIFSLTANCFFIGRLGGLNILITNPRDIPHMISEMERFKFTVITGVNTLFNALLKNPHFADLDFRALKVTLGGGMAVQKIVAEHWQEVTNNPISEAYGLTETSPCVAMNIANMPYTGCIGVPVPSTEIKIVDDHEKELPIGEVGELAIKGPQVMLGYWNKPEETKKTFTKDGWLLTGDIGIEEDNGFFRILERKKDMILVSGFNVYPNEVEDVIVQIPGIVEAAVVGVPDQNSGEAVKAFIVKDDMQLDENEVLRHCRKMLTGYKVPKFIEFCKELPKTNVGKILRRALKNPDSQPVP